MQVKLNAWRGEHGPGEIVDVPDGDAAAMIAHGTAHPVDDLEEKLAEAEASPSTGRVVRGSAALTATSETAHAPAP